jgi:hypothetical protein
VAKVHYEVDSSAIPPERFIAALTDFSPGRPELWPNLDLKYYKLHASGDTWAEVTEGTDLLGGVWARERYDWSVPGVVTIRLLEATDFVAGTEQVYRVTPLAGGGSHIAVDFQRTARTLRGRFVGVAVALLGKRRFTRDLGKTLDRLATTGTN